MFKKIIVSLFLVGLLASPSFASTQVISSGTSTAWVSGQYVPIMAAGSVGPTATAALSQEPIPSSGTFSKLYCKVATAPGSGKSVTLTVEIAGSGTALACTISDTNTTGSDLTHTASVTAGQVGDIAITSSGSSPTTAVVSWSLLFDGTTTNESIIAATHDTALSATNTRYAGPAAITVVSTTESPNEEVLISTGGTIKNLYVILSTALTSGNYVFTVTKNTTAQSVTCTVTSSTCSDTSNSFAVVAGDRISIKAVGNSASASPTFSVGLTFVSTTNGEFLLPFRIKGATLSTTNTEYFNMCSSPQTTENIRYSLAQAMTVKNIYALLGTAPGTAASGKQRDFTLRTNGTTNTAETVNLFETATTNSTTTNVTINNGDILSVKSVPTSTPAASTLTIGMTGYIAPTSTIDHLAVTGISDPIFRGRTSDVTVTAQDASNATVTTYTGTVTFTSNDSSATLPSNYQFVGGDNGVHTFTAGVKMGTVGEKTVTATDTVTGSITGTQSAITVLPAPQVIIMRGDS